MDFSLLVVFFIYRSFENSKSIRTFFKKRILRHFPGLLVVLLLSLVLVPFVYEGAVPLLENREFWTYLPNNLSLYGFQGVVSGVFDGNAYHAINCSLWTIRYEFTLYMAIMVLFLIKGNKNIVLGVATITALSFYVLYIFYLDRFNGSSILGMRGYHILNLGGFFVFGSWLAVLKFDRYVNVVVLTLVALLTMTSLYFGFYNQTKHILVTLLILSLGFTAIPGILDFGKLGDSSNGIYIYGFPIQQTLMYYFYINTNALIVWSVILSIFLANYRGIL